MVRLYPSNVCLHMYFIIPFHTLSFPFISCIALKTRESPAAFIRFCSYTFLEFDNGWEMILMSGNWDSSEYFIPAWGGVSVNHAH